MERRAQSDSELVEASRRGEREAFGHLVERYQDVVCAVSYSNTRDWSLSEDVAQDTFIAAWRKLDQLRETARVKPWLVGIARNLARKATKRRDREEPAEDVEIEVAGESSPFEHAARGESERVVRDALGRVPDTYREVLVLYYGENRSAREVATALGITETAALQRLARGRRYLADGVTDLVETSLRGMRVRRSLVPGVLAAITAIGATSSRVDASTAKGSTMLKVALATVTLAAAGTTAAVVHHQRAEEPTVAAAVVAPASKPVAGPVAAHAPRAPNMPAQRMYVDENGKPIPPELRAPEPDVNPTVSKEQIDKLGLYRGPARGPANAKVTIVVFQDSVCHYCSLVLGTIDQLWDEYPGKLRLVIKQFPVHKQAVLGGEAMYAADAQGKFWEMHDLLIQHQADDQSHDALIEYAKQIPGLDVAAFTTALDTHAFAGQVKEDQAAGKAIDVSGTPTFLINGRRFMGARQIEDFRTSINAALQD